MSELPQIYEDMHSGRIAGRIVSIRDSFATLDGSKHRAEQDHPLPSLTGRRLQQVRDPTSHQRLPNEVKSVSKSSLSEVVVSSVSRST